jgi:hypothetical protein
MVESKGVGYHPEHQVTSVDAAAHHLTLPTVSPRRTICSSTCRRTAPAVVHEAGLTDESGWIPVDRHSFTTRYPHVYAIGDVTIVPLAMGKPLPRRVYSHTVRPRLWPPTLRTSGQAVASAARSTAMESASSRPVMHARVWARATYHEPAPLLPARTQSLVALDESTVREALVDALVLMRITPRTRRNIV